MKLVWNLWFLFTVSSRGCSVYYSVPTPWYLEKTMGLNQWCAGQVAVNKVINRQNLRSMVNKLTVTFNRHTIIGNNLSASFGILDVSWCSIYRSTFLSDWAIMFPRTLLRRLPTIDACCNGWEFALPFGSWPAFQRWESHWPFWRSSDCWLWLWRLTVDCPPLV